MLFALLEQGSEALHLCLGASCASTRSPGADTVTCQSHATPDPSHTACCLDASCIQRREAG